MKNINVPVEKEMKEALEKLAKKDRRSLANYLRLKFAELISEQTNN